MGMRVEAVWRPREEWEPGLQNIEYFRPTGEPDAPVRLVQGAPVRGRRGGRLRPVPAGAPPRTARPTASRCSSRSSRRFSAASASPRPTSGSGARARRTTSPAAPSRSSRRSTRSGRCRRSTSHTSRLDAAWALYEAWSRSQTGEVDTALVYGFGKSSAGDLRRTLALQLDPYMLAPLWPDAVAVAGLQARLGIDAGQVERAGDGRGRRAQPTRRARPTRSPSSPGPRMSTNCCAEPLPRRATAPPRLRADHRRRRRDRARRRGPGARAGRPARPGSPASPTASTRPTSARGI